VPTATRRRGGVRRLVRDAADGNRAAMESLLMRAQETAYRFSVTVCGHTDDAEDVMQEALIKTYGTSPASRARGVSPWLYRTVRNACLMRRRRRVDEPRHVLSLDELVATPAGPVARRALAGKDPERS